MAGTAYWVGGDGNVYAKGSNFNGVQQIGKAGGTVNTGRQVTHSNGVTTLIPLNEFIADPNPQKSTAPGPVNPNNTGGGASQVADKSNDIALNNAGLSAVDTQTQSGLDAIGRSLGGIIGGYDTEKTANEKTYGTQSDANQGNLQKNKQSALVGAVQGRQGLFGTLSSLGALNGDGINLANRAVQNGANEDLSGAEDNFEGNQVNLDTAITRFRDEDTGRRKRAEDAAENARIDVRNNSAKNKQQFLTNLSNDYSAMGDSGNAGRYSSMAASLYPDIARTSVPGMSLAPESAAFTPGTLSSYLANTGSTQVSATPAAGTGGGAALPGLVANNNQKKKTVTA